MTYAQRRAHLATLLRNHPDPSQFNMRGWDTCVSAVACADPTFNKLGLYADPPTSGCSPNFEGRRAFNALVLFFGYEGFGDPAFKEVFSALNNPGATTLDNPGATPLDIARRLEAQTQ